MSHYAVTHYPVNHHLAVHVQDSLRHSVLNVQSLVAESRDMAVRSQVVTLGQSPLASRPQAEACDDSYSDSSEDEEWKAAGAVRLGTSIPQLSVMGRRCRGMRG